MDDLRKQLDAIPRKLAEDDDGRKLLDEAAAIGTAADQVAARRTEELADIDSRLAGLGPAPEKGAPADAPDVAEQRASLARQRSAVDSELKLARLVSVDADQRGNELIRQRREQFQAALTARTDSPLGRPFWRNLRAAAPLDAARLQGLGRELRQAVASTMASDRRGGFIASLAAALLIALLGPWLAERLLVRAAPARLPSGRLRRSLRAAATVLINTLLIGLAAQLAWSVLKAGDGFSESLDALAKASVQVTLFGAFVVSLGQTLLSRRRSSWRLPGVSDELAERLSPYPWWIAAGAALNGLVTEVNAIIGASLAAEVTGARPVGPADFGRGHAGPAASARAGASGAGRRRPGRACAATALVGGSARGLCGGGQHCHHCAGRDRLRGAGRNAGAPDGVDRRGVRHHLPAVPAGRRSVRGPAVVQGQLRHPAEPEPGHRGPAAGPGLGPGLGPAARGPCCSTW